MSDVNVHRGPDPAELSRQVRFCVERACSAVVLSSDPERRDIIRAFASSLLSELESDPFQSAEDIAQWMADELDEAIADRDAWHGPLLNVEIGARLTFVVELAKWLFPTFGRLPTSREEIARLRVWPRPFGARGEA